MCEITVETQKIDYFWLCDEWVSFPAGLIQCKGGRQFTVTLSLAIH